MLWLWLIHEVTIINKEEFFFKFLVFQNLLMQVPAKTVSTSPIVSGSSSVLRQVDILGVVQLPDGDRFHFGFLYIQETRLHLYSEFIMVLITLGSRSNKTDLTGGIMAFPIRRQLKH